MNIEDFIIDTRDVEMAGQSESRPLVLIDLHDLADNFTARTLPPYPVIGFGDASHPFASHLDSVVESPVTIEGLVRSVMANPVAAAIVVQLLRVIEDLPVDQALVMESLAYAALQGGAEHALWLAGNLPGAGSPPGTVDLHRDGETLSIVMNRPEAANAIDVPMRDGLREAFDLANLDPTIRRIELRGAGRAFGSGADLSEFGTTRDPAMAHYIRQQTLPAIAAARCAERMTAYVQGLCIGSTLELAAFAGRIEARRDAIFRLGELSMGILPGAGGCVSLSRRIGRQRTALMVLSGRRISAAKALQWGLVDAIVD